MSIDAVEPSPTGNPLSDLLSARELADAYAEERVMRGELAEALGEIARGRKDCGRPLAAEAARQIARRALGRQGIGWPAGAARKR